MASRNYVNRFYRLAISQVNVRTPQKRFLQIAFFLIATLAPLKSYSACPNATGDIPFFVTNESQGEVCIECTGPWLRDSDAINISAGEKDCEFYAANKTAFSPYGEWNCFLLANCFHNATIFDSIFFCVGSGASSVNLLIDESTDLSSDKPAPPCSASVPSFLGDNSKQEKTKPDADVFLFDGAGGDEVQLRLEADPQAGNNGGSASLGISGDSLSKSTGGTLPVEINTTLPADGEYAITIEQPRIPEDQRFRGSYILSVESSTGDVDLIMPTNNVEK